MRSVQVFTLAGLSLAVLACNDDPLKSGLPETPPPPTQGVQAFVQVDNTAAQPGDLIHVFVRVQMGTETSAKVGSYTGRLKFDPEVLAFKSEVKINDGLRVTNPNGAGTGELRFAGATAAGFTNLTLYEGVFEVKKAGYQDAFKLEMEELSAAMTLTNLRQNLEVPNQIFLRRTGQ
jgi:hypothetical protein